MKTSVIAEKHNTKYDSSEIRNNSIIEKSAKISPVLKIVSIYEGQISVHLFGKPARIFIKSMAHSISLDAM